MIGGSQTLLLPQAAMLVYRVQLWRNKSCSDSVRKGDKKVDETAVSEKLGIQTLQEMMLMARSELRFLEDAISKVHRVDVKLKDYELKCLGKNEIEGFFSCTKRCHLYYSDEDAACRTGLPKTLILKAAGAFNDTWREMALETNAYEREHIFYTKVLPLLGSKTPLRVPQLYESRFGEFSEDASTTLGLSLGSTFILMEDLAPIAVTGNQVKGLKPADVKNLIISSAHLHATFWQGRGRRAASTPKAHQQKKHKHDLHHQAIPDYVVRGKDDFSFLQSLMRNYVEKYPTFLQTRGYKDFDVDLDEEAVMSIGSHIYENADRILDLVCRDMPQTLIHADYRADNVMLMENGCAVLDWQLYCTGNGLYDVANIIISSMSVSDSEDHCVELLKLYQKTLVDLGVTDYLAWQPLWNDFRICILQLGSIFSYWADAVDEHGTLKADYPEAALKLFKAFHKRVLAAAIRYECASPNLLI